MTGKLTIMYTTNGYIITHNLSGEGIERISVSEGNDTKNTIQLLRYVNDLVGKSYNKFADDNENVFIITGPGHKSDNFDKIHDIVWRNDE